MCDDAIAILKDKNRRPPHGHGRVAAIAEAIHDRYPGYSSKTIADYIRDAVREWERKNPGE
jgi:hypothetical protein